MRREYRLQFLEYANGKSTMVARNLGRVSFSLGASPDGRTILYRRVDSSVDDLMLVENFRGRASPMRNLDIIAAAQCH